MTIKLLDVKKYYKGIPHQKIAVSFLHEILLNTPAKERLGLSTQKTFLELSDDRIEWLQRQLEGTSTLNKFAELWRADSIDTENTSEVVAKIFSQRDNSILPYVTCSSSSHASYVDYLYRKWGKEGLSSDEEYLKKVFSGKYSRVGSSRNKSIYWEVHDSVLKDYGINSKYIWNGDLNGLKKEVEKNGASVINIFHKGTSRSNRGGGHVVLATQFHPNGAVDILDPFGERPPYYNLKNVGARQSSKQIMDDEYETLHRLVLCEARGEGVLGMAIVARTTLNRVNLTAKRLENFMTSNATIEGVIYAKNQYEPTWSRNNHIDSIYSRTTESTKNDGHKAIQLAQNPDKLIQELISKGYGKNDALTIARSTFFAAKSHPGAISPYVDRMVTVGGQVCGEGKNTTKVPNEILFKPYEFKKGQKGTEDVVGSYVMTASEFSWRWQGLYRYLV